MLDSSFQSWVDALYGWSSVGLFCFAIFSNFLENVFPPWPGDSVTVFLGFYVAQTKANLSWEALVLATFVGNWTGALVMYAFGTKILKTLEKSRFGFLRSLSNPENLKKTQVWFQKNSFLVVSLSRFSAGLRFFVAIVAGALQMPLYSFFVSYTIGISLWCGLLIYGGFALGQNWEIVLGWLQVYQRVLSILSLLAAGFIFSIWHRRKSKISN